MIQEAITELLGRAEEIKTAKGVRHLYLAEVLTHLADSLRGHGVEATRDLYIKKQVPAYLVKGLPNFLGLMAGKTSL